MGLRINPQCLFRGIQPAHLFHPLIAPGALDLGPYENGRGTSPHRTFSCNGCSFTPPQGLPAGPGGGACSQFCAQPHLWPDYLPSQGNLLSVSYRRPLPRQGPGGMTSLGTFCLGHLPIWALSAYFLGLGQAVDKGITTLDNQPSTENTPLS